MTETETEVDRLARILAAKAGLEWERLGQYPGYLRTIWREEARALLSTATERSGPRIHGCA